ncbi:MAG: lipoate--protein ligase, partial [Candidatus Atribacteria bacterium]|nr:lipoate--protein ligase [Candidatus Atribacteria bacterium]
LHHGTLLFDSDLDVLEKVLKINIDKIQSKSIKSIRNRVTNISDYLIQKIDMQEFKSVLLKYLFKGEIPIQHHLTEKDLEEVNRLVKDKYATWDWNYSKSPNYSLFNSSRFSGGKIECYLDVKNGIIKNSKIYGDFLSINNIADIEKEINGKKYEREALTDVLLKFNLFHYFGDISMEEILSVFFG